MANNFYPGVTYSLSATTASANVAVAPANTYNTIRIVNLGVVPVYINFGTASTVAATISNMCVLPGSVELFFIDYLITYIAAITASGNATLNITLGTGQ